MAPQSPATSHRPDAGPDGERRPGSHRIECACGRVAYDAEAAPIMSVVCYCASCQEGGRRIERLPGAGPVLDADGGTRLTVFDARSTRCVHGEELVVGHRLDDGTITERRVASCCNTGLMMAFDKGPYWVSAFSRRVEHAAPPEWRVQTAAAPDPDGLPGDIPSFSRWPLRFVLRLLRRWPRLPRSAAPR